MEVRVTIQKLLLLHLNNKFYPIQGQYLREIFSSDEKETVDFFRCWHKSPEERPSMDEVVEIMTTLSQFFNGHLEPVEYSRSTYVSRKYVEKPNTRIVASCKSDEDIVNKELQIICMYRDSSHVFLIPYRPSVARS